MHILEKPEQAGYIFIPELKQPVQKAMVFKETKEVKIKQQPEGTFIYLDGVALNDLDTVIELRLK